MRTVPISSGLNTRRIDQATHSSSSCSPIQVRFIQVVALAVDPPNCVRCSAVDVLTPADVIGSPLQLKERHYTFISQVAQLTLSKAPVFSGIFKRSRDLNMDNWRAKRRRLCIATMLVALLTLTNGRVWVASKDCPSRMVNSSTAALRSSMISSLCLSEIWDPIVFLTLSSLTSFPRSFEAGNPPGQHKHQTNLIR